MAGVKISELPVVPAVALTDIFPDVHSGVTYQATLLDVRTLFGFNSGTGLLALNKGGTNAALVAALGGVVYSTASALAISSALTNGQLLIGSTGLAPAVGTLTAGSGITITNGAGSITLSSSGGLTVVNVTGTSGAITVNSRQIANNAGLVTLTLPATAAVGDVIEVQGSGAGGWLIAQNANQTIRIGSVASTVGVGGSVASSNRYDSLKICCIVANNEFAALGGPQSAGLTIT